MGRPSGARRMPRERILMQKKKKRVTNEGAD
jgi:hypothetical protein